ncbi:ATP-binding protein [Dyadobacter subterraneus]|uniref:histidine kinase n=1 Tax=Dyadobacter subterraneus TaxID=2773304 RepID=A0ABR9WBS5_9BACT|nr:ATP-binding protein [Dyadobacter subterraneus]MBE9461674.1 PAS domain S-box protein [Dyadobacter subterraneus]
MQEIINFKLENDLDLVLAHKRSMQLAETCGLGLVAQTSFATAVSEVARLMIERGALSAISLYVGKSQKNHGIIRASVNSPTLFEIDLSNEKILYAQRLVNNFVLSATEISMDLDLPKNLSLTGVFIEKCKTRFKTALPISPYEEVKRKNAELQQLADNLVQSENRYQQLTNALPLMMFILAKDGQMLYANEWFLNFTGKNLESLTNTNWLTWLSVHHVEVDLIKLRVTLEKRMPFQQEVLLTSLDGNTIWHLLSLTPQENTSGKGIIQWFGFIVNIHAQKVVEKTLRDNHELIQIKRAMELREKQLDQTILELNRSNQELDRYAYVASHDLQEPTRKIILLSDMVIERYALRVPPEAKDLLVRVKGAAERMHSLVTDLLAYSRINSGKLLTSKISLSDIIRNITENLEYSIVKTNARIRLNDSYLICGNVVQMQQLFQNLIGNAIKFTEKGKDPDITITAEPLTDKQIESLELAQDHWLSIQVSDNGIGFDQIYAERIFEVFQRLHSRKEFEGTGIGLSICKKIVELHGGKISVVSNIGQGSSFTFYLPYEP